jgi:hypothetical protein
MLTIRVWLGLVIWLVVAAVIGFLIAPQSNAGFADDAAVLSFATLVAIGIERVIELMWSLASQSQRAGGWWPLKQVTQAIDTVMDETNAFLGDHVTNTITLLKAAKEKAGVTEAQRKALDIKIAEIADLQRKYQKQLRESEKLAPGSERLALVAGISGDVSAKLREGINLADEVSSDTAKLIAKSDETIDFALTIVESFSDNPARRVASILIGGGLGIIVSGFVGLNIFSAVLGSQAGALAAGIGVVLTGFIVGLGSSPTHEVIKALQNYKQSKGTMVSTQTGGTGGTEERPQIVRVGAQDMAGGGVGSGGTATGGGSRRVMLRGTQ